MNICPRPFQRLVRENSARSAQDHTRPNRPHGRPIPPAQPSATPSPTVHEPEIPTCAAITTFLPNAAVVRDVHLVVDLRPGSRCGSLRATLHGLWSCSRQSRHHLQSPARLVAEIAGTSPVHRRCAHSRTLSPPALSPCLHHYTGYPTLVFPQQMVDAAFNRAIVAQHPMRPQSRHALLAATRHRHIRAVACHQRPSDGTAALHQGPPCSPSPHTANVILRVLHPRDASVLNPHLALLRRESRRQSMPQPLAFAFSSASSSCANTIASGPAFSIVPSRETRRSSPAASIPRAAPTSAADLFRTCVINRSLFRPAASSSSAGEPTATGQDSVARSPQS